MKADYEQLTYTEKMLRETWVRQIEHFLSLIEGGWTNSEVVELIRFISENKYGEMLFPGSSLGRLLISKPQSGKLNYQQTLEVAVNHSNGKILMTYTNFDLIDNFDEYKNAIEWHKEVTDRNLIYDFLEFVEWNKSWF